MSEIDDFFDTPRPKDSTIKTNLNQPGRKPSPTVSDDHDNASGRRISHANSTREPEKSRNKETTYNSESEDDRYSQSKNKERPNSGRESRNTKTVIEAKVPVVTKSDDYEYGNDSFESDSEDERKNSVRHSRSNKNASPRSGKDGSARSGSRSPSEDSRGSRSPNGRIDKRNHVRKSGDLKASGRRMSKYSDDSDVTVTDSEEEKASKSDTVTSTRNSTLHSALSNGRKTGSRSKKHVTMSDIESGELSALLQTVLDMDREDSRAGSHVGGGSRRSGGGIVYYKQKKNYTFSNDRVKQIEQENRRLLRQIINQSDNTQKAKRQAKFSIQSNAANRPLALPRRPTSASINRNKELQRIDAENLALLKRLQSAQASRSLRRDVQINDYHQQLIRSGAISTASLAALRDCRLRGDGATSRPHSAVRPQSGKSCSSLGGSSSIYSTRLLSRNSRPDWNDRWHVNERA